MNVKGSPAKDNIKPGVILAREPSRAMQEMMDIIDHLHGIIDEETRALENADTKTFLGLQEEKLIAAQAYHDGATQIIQRKAEFADVRETFKKHLEKKQKSFNASVESNMKRIRSVSKGIQRISNLLMENAREQGQKMQTLNYNHGGKFENTANKTVSIGINESA